MNAEWWNYSDYEFRKENSVKIKLIDCLWNCMPNSCMEIRAIRLLVTTKRNYKNCKGLRADYTHEETSRPENNKLAVTEIQIQSKSKFPLWIEYIVEAQKTAHPVKGTELKIRMYDIKNLPCNSYFIISDLFLTSFYV